MPGTEGGAGDFTLDARYLVKHDRGLQVWAIDRRTQALEDTSAFAAALRGQIPLQQAFDYYLGGGGLPLPGRQRRPVRPRVGDVGGPQRRPRRGAQGSRPRPPAGRPRRALPRRLADRRLRRLGLQRPAGLQGPERVGADRRRPARELRCLRPRAGAEGRHRPADERPVPRPARCGPARGGRNLRRGRRALRREGPDRLRDDPAVVPAAPGRVQPSLPGHQSRPVRVRVRP